MYEYSSDSRVFRSRVKVEEKDLHTLSQRVIDSAIKSKVIKKVKKKKNEKL